MKEEVRTLIVNHDVGLHCRPSASFVKTANKFECDIFVEKDGEKVNGKSILELMMLKAINGSKINITAIGNDAIEALNALSKLDFLVSV